MADLLHRIDAAVDGLCPCGAEPAPGSAYCGDECRPTHRGPDTDSPLCGPPTAARWRPDLVDTFDDSQMILVRTVQEDPYLTRRLYRRHDSDSWWFRLDDGHRYVGVEVAPEVVLDPEGSMDVWARLRRELTDPRRLDPDAPEAASHVEYHYCMWAPRDEHGRHRCGLMWSDGSRCDAVTADPASQQMTARVVAEGMFWLPGPTADPEAPTLADLEGSIDLTPYLAPGQAQSRFAQDAAAYRASVRMAMSRAATAVTEAVDAYQSLPRRTRVVLWLRFQWDTLREDGLREWLWGWWGIWRHRFRRR